jgi:spermidine synthase
MTSPSTSAPRPGASDTALGALALLFACTGCTALLAEQAFEKLLSTLLGASTPAAATVLAAYFGGFGLGGALFGRWFAARRVHPMRVYAVLELWVGLWAFGIALAFDRMIGAFAPILALAGDDATALTLARLAVAGLWILPLTVPMGATFPAVVHAVERLASAADRGRIVRLYAWNLAGAIAGAVLGPFIVFPAWGADGALFAAAAVNVLVALVAHRVARRAPERESVPDAPARDAARAPGSLLAMAFLSGALLFALEVLWAHLIGAVLGNSVYAFAAMLACVLAGLGLGGAAIGRRGDVLPNAEVGRLLLAASLALAAIGSAWDWVPLALAALGAHVHSFGAAETLRWTLAAIMLVPVATLFGMVYPMLFRLERFPRTAQGTAAGALVGANAVGSIVGALGTGFVLIPALGSEGTQACIAILAAAWALALLGMPSVRNARVLVQLAILGLVLAGVRWDRLQLTSGRHVYFGYSEVFRESVLRMFHEDTRGGITTVVDTPAGVGHQAEPYRTLLTNGKFQGNDGWEMEAQSGFALVPLLHARHFDRALVIGLGTGRTAHVVDAAGFARVDVAEIAPGVVAAAREHFAHANGDVLARPSTRLLLEDGRNALVRHRAVYDLMTIELSNVWFQGATNLYSVQFYELARRRLAPHGVLQQWIQLHHITEDELRTAVASLRAAFPYVSVWHVGLQAMMLGSPAPQELTAEGLSRLARIGPALGWGPERFEALFASRLLAPDDVDAWLSSAPTVLNTDRNRRLEYRTPRHNYDRRDLRALNVRRLARHARCDPSEVEATAAGALADAARRARPITCGTRPAGAAR